MLKIFANATDSNKDAQNDLGASGIQLGSNQHHDEDSKQHKEKNTK